MKTLAVFIAVLLYSVTLSSQERITLLFVGDLMQHQAQIDAAHVSEGKYDYSSCFSLIKEQISQADLAIGNLEVTLGGRPYRGYPMFSAPDEYLQAIKDAGFDILLTANNHCLDRGKKGMERTIQLLDSSGIRYAGTYKNLSERRQRYPLFINRNGFRIALLNYTYGTNGIKATSPNIVNYIDKNTILQDIQSAKARQPDAIIACMHWGEEYQTKPNSEQKRLANLLFENGVDIILGSHPHVLQPMEKKEITLEDGMTKECFVIYSLGNFMSGQVKEGTRDSIILNLDIKKSGETGKTTISKVDYIPIYMYKSTTGNTKRYKILDLEKKDFNNELSKIRKIMN